MLYEVITDRTPNPHAWECKYVFQPVVFEFSNVTAGEVRITNRFNFTNLNAYEVRWSLWANGKQLQAGILPSQDVAPGSSIVTRLPFKTPKYNSDTEYWVRLSVHETKKQLWFV